MYGQENLRVLNGKGAVEGLKEANKSCQVWSNNGTRRARRGGSEYVLNAVNSDIPASSWPHDRLVPLNHGDLMPAIHEASVVGHGHSTVSKIIYPKYESTASG